MARLVRGGSALILVVHVASPASLAEIMPRAAEAVCPAYTASSNIVALAVLRSYRRLRYKRFAHAAAPRCCDAYEPPNAEPACLPLIHRRIRGRMRVLCSIEAGRLAHGRMRGHAAEPGIGREVLAASSGGGVQAVFRRCGASHVQKPRHLAGFIGLIESCSIQPASVAVATVLRATRKQGFCVVAVLVEVGVTIKLNGLQICREPCCGSTPRPTCRGLHA